MLHRCSLLLPALLALGGCATQVHFDSSPPGAEVVYERSGQVIGVTPFDLSIKDHFGWFSIYRFTATMTGFESTTLEFRERSPLDAQQVVPSTVRFDLKKQQPTATVTEAAVETAPVR